MSALPKTLLLTPTPPGQGSVGENFLRQLVNSLPQNKVCCFAPWSTRYAIWKSSPELDWLPLQIEDLPEEILNDKVSNGMFRNLHLMWKRREHWNALNPIADRAVEFGKQHDVEAVLAVLASPSLIRITADVARRLNARLYSLVWDPPQSTMKLLQFEQSACDAVMSDFGAALRMSERVALASDGMREEYERAYGITGSITLVRSMDRSLRKPLTAPTDQSKFTIGFCGTIYAVEEFKTLLWALNELDWSIDGRQITLKIMGNSFSVPVYVGSRAASIEFLGHRELPKAVDILRTCDIAYLPYWFDEQFSLSVRCCFPDKLVTYATAGVPILFHGPAVSSPARFMQKFPVGKMCNSLYTGDLANTILKMARDGSLRERCFDAGNAAAEEELSQTVFEQRLQSLFSADEKVSAMLSLHH